MITDQLLSKATEGIITSRTIRGEIRPLVVSVQANKTEAHGKISTAISESVEQAKKQKVCQEKRKKNLHSPAGNRTRVFRVTGGDTYHYTTEDLLMYVV